MSTTEGTGWKAEDVNAIPPVKPDWPATWKSVRHHFGITSFGVNAVTKDAGNVLIPEHDERESGQEELYFVHAGEVQATLDGEAVTIPAGGQAEDRGDRVAHHADRGRRDAGQGVRDRALGAVAP
jgi:uncharacterized cupin superfamily protein